MEKLAIGKQNKNSINLELKKIKNLQSEYQLERIATMKNCKPK